MFLQKWQWWKQNCARSEARHGQDSVAAHQTATSSARNGRMQSMVPATSISVDLIASATSIARHITSSCACTQAAFSFAALCVLCPLKEY